jgi:NurA domain
LLVETFDYAVSNRQKILSRIDLKSDEATVEKAKGRWTGFRPPREHDDDVELAGIDSSWNFIPYQGFYVYAVNAVTMLADGSCLVPPVFDVGLSTLAVEVVEHGMQVDKADSRTWVSNPSVALESIGMEYEYTQAQESIRTGEKVDFVLVDGSILARFYDRKRGKQSSYYDYARELAKQQRTLFVSKTSYSNTTLDGPFGDMFYYNRVSTDPGYSEPWVDERTRVSVCYVRLTEYSPSIRLEVPGEIKSEEIENLMGVLRSGSVDGYPYVLRLAHERGKISHDQMEKLANLLELNTQIGGRQVLGE